MDDEIPDPAEAELGSRPPVRGDLIALCGELNRVGAQYVVIGGLAIIQAGYSRTTGDIDLLVDASLENEAKVFAALDSLRLTATTLAHEGAHASRKGSGRPSVPSPALRLRRHHSTGVTRQSHDFGSRPSGCRSRQFSITR